ncbi:hypothetical protein VZO05_00370 [Aggregatilineales bacterium SYSU G02658]
MTIFLQITSLLLIVCTLLLLWGCSARPVSLPLMDDAANAPLLATVRMPLPYVETLPNQFTPRPVFASTPALTLPYVNDARLITPPAVCFRQAQRGLVCIGQAINTGLQAVENLRLRLSVSGIVQTITPEQRVIPAGGFAPYRAIFPNSAEERAAVDVLNLRASSQTPPPLTVLREVGSYLPQPIGYGLYRYEATLRADEDYSQPWQAVVTLFSSSQQAVGYRVIEQQEGLVRGQTITLRADITPLLVDTRYYTTLTVSPR